MLNLFTKKICLLKLLLCCFLTIHSSVNAQITDYNFTACYGDTLVLPAALPQECPLPPVPIEVFDFLNPITSNYDEIIVVVEGEGTFTYDFSSVGGDCPPIVYTYNISFDASCTNTPVITEFDFEVCIGDTITAPAIFPGTCPLGPFPTEANPNGPNHIIDIISIGPDEISFVALGSGSFPYSLPVTTSPIDGSPCSSDLNIYNITIKDDCVYEPIVYNFEVCEGDIISVYVPNPSGSCAIGHTENPEYPTDELIDFLGHEIGDNFEFIPLESGSITIDEIPTDPFGNDCDGLLQPVTINFTVNYDCIPDVTYTTDNCVCDVCDVTNPLDLPWIQDFFADNLIAEIRVFWDQHSQQILFEPISSIGPVFYPLIDCAGDIYCVPNDPNSPISCVDLLDYENFDLVGSIIKPDGESHCGSDGNTYETLCELECNGATEINCPVPAPDFAICVGDTILIEGPTSLPSGPQGFPGSPSACTTIGSVSISPIDGVIGETTYGFYVVPQENITYTLESTATGGGGPGSPGCTPRTVSNDFDIVVNNCQDPQPPNGPQGPNGAETDFPSIYSLVDTNNCCDNQTVRIYSASNGDKFLYVEPNPDCSTNNPILYDANGAVFCIGNATTDCIASFDIITHNYTWTCATDDECACVSGLNTVYDIDGNEYANPCIAECAGIEYYDEIVEPEPDATVCLGDPVGVLIEGPSVLPAPPQGPDGQVPCGPFVNAVSISPTDGVISDTDFGFYVSPTTTTTYTITSTAGPAGPGGGCVIHSQTSTFTVEVEDCQPEPDLVVCLGDPIGVLIEGPSAIPAGPQGANTCPMITQVSISPTDGVVSDTDYGFYVSPTTTTTYTITSTTGPGGPGSTCTPQTYTSTFIIDVIESCETEPELDALVCLGDEVGVLIEGPSVLPPGPQGPNGQTSCTQVTQISISPNEGIISQTPYGFYVSPTSTTVYSIISTAGLLGPGGGCTPQSSSSSFVVGVTQNCHDEPEPCIVTDPSELPFIQEIVANNCAEVCGTIDQITAFGYNGNTYFGLIDNISAPDCPLGNDGVTYVDCNGDFFCSTNTLNAGENFCSDEFIDIASNATVIWYNDNICDDGGNNPTPDTGYDWLDDLLDPNDCCANESVVEFAMGSYSFIYIKTSADCGGLGELYINTGQLYCSDADNFDCLAAYGLNISQGSLLWSCGDEPVTCVIDDPLTLPFIQDITANNCADVCGSIDEITTFTFNGNTYFGLYDKITAPECPIGFSGTTFVDCDGNFACTTQPFGQDTFCSDEFLEIAYNNHTVIWSNNNICDDEEHPTPEPDTPYDWLNDLLSDSDCCNANAAIEFPMGAYSFIYVSTDDACGGLGDLYLNTGQLYCSDAENFDCLEAYGLSINQGVELWNCQDGPTDPPGFGQYTWLNDIIDLDNCCVNQSVIEFPMGSYSFIYVKASTDCGGLGTLYLNTGELYCEDMDNFDCLGAYGLNENGGNVIWSCDGPTDPPGLDDFPWLADLVDTDNCCANTSVYYYKQNDCAYGYIYITGDGCDGNYGRLYDDEGLLYCTSTATISCFDHYELGTSFMQELLWACELAQPNEGLAEQSSRLGNGLTNSMPIEMKAYPNPSNGLVNISLNTIYEGEQTIRVLDLSGRTINEIRFTEAQNQVFQTDLSDLPDGLYLIEYSNANVSSVEKIMIRH